MDISNIGKSSGHSRRPLCLFHFRILLSKKNSVSLYMISYEKETDNISVQEGKKTGKIVYVNDNGEQAVIKDGVNGEIAAVLTVGREEIGEELKKEGYAGTDRGMSADYICGTVIAVKHSDILRISQEYKRNPGQTGQRACVCPVSA